ncbi:hypothetical protein WG66_015796, partial [Moniliophthora roreri]
TSSSSEPFEGENAPVRRPSRRTRNTPFPATPNRSLGTPPPQSIPKLKDLLSICSARFISRSPESSSLCSSEVSRCR